MPQRSLPTAAVVLLSGLFFSLTALAHGQENVIYTFAGGASGAYPFASGVILDAGGSLYGTTLQGGIYGCGTVFRLTPAGNSWTPTVLYNFQGGSDGCFPYAGVIFDAAGDLYGTTEEGGANGVGTVFKLTPTNGGYAESVLYTFAGYPGDGSYPIAGLILDKEGNLYGTTQYGGSGSCVTSSRYYGCGVVFELTSASGLRTELTLHTFQGSDGALPTSGLTFDPVGDLYGTNYQGGTFGLGTVFELIPSGGTWTESVLHSFSGGDDGGQPFQGVVLDAAGSLYGTTLGSNTFPYGNVFRLKLINGSWVETVLHNFGLVDGAYPFSGLTFDAAGNLYGTTQQGGTVGGGTGFKLVPSGDSWVESVLYSFTGSADGSWPEANLTIGKAGSLYGTTAFGGSGSGLAGYGVVFEITPMSLLFPVKEPGAAPYTPQNAPITAVFDHNMAKPYDCGGPGWGGVTAFTAQSASDPVTNLAFGCRGTATPLYGYSNPSISSFLAGYNYQGPIDVLYYDGHPGYDYKFGSTTPLYPAINGCVDYGQDAAGVTAANGHVLAIIPQSTRPLGGCHHGVYPSGYSIVYMHLSSYYDAGKKQVMRCTGFDQTTGACIKKVPCPTCASQDDWVSTDRMNPIAYPGNFLVTIRHPDGWGGVPFHLHFEVDKITNKAIVPVDPYGWCGAPGTDPYTALTGQVNTTLWKQFVLTCPTLGQ
jgi:uncharacterized repeat protein (TIGR03803 family)